MPQSRPINPDHVRLQFNRRAPLDAAQFLYGEIAQRMLSRLSYMTLQPAQILDAGCGAGHAIDPLRARYVDMDYVGVDHSPALLAVAEQRHSHQPSLWQRLRKTTQKTPIFVEADMAKTNLAAQSFDLIWSNLALHWHPEPHAVIEEWRRLLRPDKLLLFSTFGPATLIELRNALHAAGIRTATMEFVDMHDYGDLLLQHGFSDPVMDQEIITLTYKSAESLLADVRALGGNPHPARRVIGRADYLKLIQALESQRHMDGTIHLSIEVAYGHAWRTAIQKQGNEIHIPISSIKRKN
ncbi:methyltransferase domain-containing protein [Paenalcaligenes faecalis]|uniref:methyltransferase domain-containing protein n=1 Tax=Paenalcaligenes faecalis TaxID=2980099 RepID=UPI0022B99BB8|nr:methyltransferase domain-containing protein [Paenalcaligenes faecalis]